MENKSNREIKIISHFQILMLTLAQGGGAAIMYVPGVLEAGRDVWLSLVVASVMGYLVIYFNFLPLSLCPG